MSELHSTKGEPTAEIVTLSDFSQQSPQVEKKNLSGFFREHWLGRFAAKSAVFLALAAPTSYVTGRALIDYAVDEKGPVLTSSLEPAIREQGDRLSGPTEDAAEDVKEVRRVAEGVELDILRLKIAFAEEFGVDIDAVDVEEYFEAQQAEETSED